MSDYMPPVEEMLFLLFDVLGFSHEDLDRETAQAALEEAAKLASGVLAPLNAAGDKAGAVLEDGAVKTAPGFKEAYKQYCEGGWNAVPFDPDYGGQGLPWALAFPVQEMWQGANLSFGLCPLLNQGAVEAISAHGTAAQKALYLPHLISGEWTGTMNLTESQAGSDLGLLRAKAERREDGAYAITGQKIFITYGEHDMADNIIHLVLARLPDAPEDVKGISLFIVPKILEDGTRNAVHCIGVEHKLGIHASPTCTMEFDGATGYLLGTENEGLKCMFTMMNNARLSVGLQGVALAERAYQHAASYAQERVQGKSLTSGERVAISEHPDVKRMLLSMRAQICAARALTYEAAMALDKAQAGDEAAQFEAGLLTPLVKGWGTDLAVDIASMGIQIFGGMGFIEETGAAQFYRDARILPIYEGTNGIQALDLVFRKLAQDQGRAAGAYMEKMEARAQADKACMAALSTLRQATDSLLSAMAGGRMEEAAFEAVPYMTAFAQIAGGLLLVSTAQAAKESGRGIDAAGYQEFSIFYRTHMLPLAEAHLSPLIRQT